MSYYNTCSRCGAHLDPGETCDCEAKKRTADRPTVQSINTRYYSKTAEDVQDEEYMKRRKNSFDYYRNREDEYLERRKEKNEHNKRII